ncbi:MAG: flagellar hook-length control protein FliK [Gammaproteobacteria bacterium]|nr:flagellar hook-length control protein FliK [Gammaproteobacteria bacterium]
MQSASVLLDSPAVASKSQQPIGEGSSAGGGLFDSELKQQQRQIEGKTKVNAKPASDSAANHDGDSRKSTANSTQEEVSESHVHHGKDESSDAEKVEMKGETAESDTTPEDESNNNVVTTDDAAGQPDSPTVMMSEAEVISVAASVEHEQIALKDTPSNDAEMSQKSEPTVAIDSELVKSSESEPGADSGNKLPVDELHSGKGEKVVAAIDSELVGKVAGKADNKQGVEHSAESAKSNPDLTQSTIESEISAQSEIEKSGIDSELKGVAKGDAPIQPSTDAKPTGETESSPEQNRQQVANNSATEQSGMAEELPQVVAAPSLKGISPAQGTPVATTNSVADAVGSSSTNRADALGAGNSTSSQSNANSNPNSNSDSMAGRQNFTQVGTTAVAVEGEAKEPVDKMAAFLASLKSVTKEGGKGAEVATPSQAGVKAQPVTQMVSSLTSLTALSTSPTQATAPMSPTGAVATSNATPALMTIATSIRQQGWDRAMGERLVFMARNGLQEAKIEVNPRQMGPIEIKVSVNPEQQASVSFLTTNSAARETIDAAMPRLREMFDEAGLNLAESEVSQRDERQSGSSESDDERSATDTVAGGVEEDLDTLTSAQVGYVRPAGLDLFA